MVIPLTIGAVVKWFGSRRKDADDDVQGDHPIVRAMLKGVNTGDYDDITALIDDQCRFYINAEDIAREDDTLDHGPDLWVDAITDTRAVYPDLHWELYDELSGEDEGKQKIIIRFVSNAETKDGETEAFEVAGFGIVEDDKLVEWRQVADMQTYNRRRVLTGEDPIASD